LLKISKIVFCWPLRELNRDEKYKDVNFQLVHSARKKKSTKWKKILTFEQVFFSHANIKYQQVS